jgi:hypothetical protein
VTGCNLRISSLAAALRVEVRRFLGRDLRKALRPLRSVERRLKTLRDNAKAQRRALRAVERRFERLHRRVGGAGGRGRRGQISAEGIRSLRARLGMSRAAFAKLVGVSPGSIFGWETGRTVPRGRSMARVIEVRKMGVRRARAASPPARRGRRGRPARSRRTARRAA